MKIEIKSRWDSNKVLLAGKYASVRECLEKNRGAYLRGAYLGGAYLGGADLEGAYLEGAYLGGADLEGADLEGADLRGAYLEGAYLGGAYLGGAYLGGADLRGAYLGGAYLEGAKNYLNSHDFFKEIIKRQKLETFTNPEWAIIGQIIVHTLCWESIKKRYGKKVMSIFKKLSRAGFSEWEEKYKELIK